MHPPPQAATTTTTTPGCSSTARCTRRRAWRRPPPSSLTPTRCRRTAPWRSTQWSSATTAGAGCGHKLPPVLRHCSRRRPANGKPSSFNFVRPGKLSTLACTRCRAFFASSMQMHGQGTRPGHHQHSCQPLLPSDSSERTCTTPLPVLQTENLVIVLVPFRSYYPCAPAPLLPHRPQPGRLLAVQRRQRLGHHPGRTAPQCSRRPETLGPHRTSHTPQSGHGGVRNTHQHVRTTRTTDLP